VPGCEPQGIDPVFKNGGRMGALMRSFDWSTSLLGPVSEWSESLRTAVGTCLNSQLPMLIYWGPQRVMLYNDACSGLLGSKHPSSMGRPGRESLPEVWPTIGPMLERTMSTGEGTWSENQLLLIERNGFSEEAYFTFSFSPLFEDDSVAGVLAAGLETTAQVLGQRRMRTIRSLAERTASCANPDEVCRAAAEALAENADDAPFVLLYLLDSTATQATLTGAAGLAL
jgi:hypothetical protein